MNIHAAFRAARAEFSDVYVVAAGRTTGKTYGFNRYMPTGTRVVNSSGDYQAARRHRRDAINERANELFNGTTP